MTATGYTTATLTWVDPNDTENGYRVYRGLAAAPTTDVSGDLPADTDSYGDSGLAPGLMHYWRVATIVGAGELMGLDVSLVLPSRVSVTYEGPSSATLRFDALAHATAIEWIITTPDDIALVAVLADLTRYSDERDRYTAVDLDESTEYLAAARQQVGGSWGEWHYGSFATTAAPAAGVMAVGRGRFTAPLQGAVVAGTVGLSWALLAGYRATALEMSADGGGTWTELADDDALSDDPIAGYDHDASALDDGIILYRLVYADAADSQWGYLRLVVYVDNAGALTSVYAGITAAEFSAIHWSGDAALYFHGDKYTAYDESFGNSVVLWDGALAGDFPETQGKTFLGATAYIVAQPIWNGGTYYWWANLGIEGDYIGIDLLDDTGAARFSVLLDWWPSNPIWPGPCGDDAALVTTSTVTLWRSDRAGAQVQMGSHGRGAYLFACPDPPNCPPAACVQGVPGVLALSVSRTNPADATVFDVVLRGTGSHGPMRRADGSFDPIVASTQITLDDPLECIVGVRLRMGKGPDPGGHGLIQLLMAGFGVSSGDECGTAIETETIGPTEPCPPAEPPDGPPSSTGRPCAAHLTVYDDDRLTPLWMASTDPDDATADKILVEPDSYGEQEVDFAEGTASITAATVEVIDPPRTPGDQDTGLTTYRLVRDGITAMAGLRHRLLRWISESVGWVTIADGPGGFPRLGDSYSSYTTEIRDVRESERKLEAFTDSPAVVDECLGIVPRYVTIFPHGVTAPWGDIHGDGSEYLLDAVEPITAMHSVDLFGGGGTAFGLGHEIGAGLWHYAVGEAWPDYLVLTDDLREMGEARVVEATGQTLDLGIYGTQPLYRMEWPHLQIWWRYPGEEDWHVSELVTETATADAPTNLFGGHTTAGVVVVGYDEDGAAIREQRTVVESLPTFADWFGAYPDRYIPVGSELEFLLVYVGEATEAAPILIETTAGALLRQLYDGYWSPRDSDGAVVDPGIRYDATALDAMTQPVRLIMREIADDVRRWAEENVFKPLGFAPTLDQFGRIAPTSQRIDVDPATLITVGDAGIEPGPDWCAGDRVVNSVEFRYPRTWVVDGPDPDMELADFSGLVRESREVRVQERSDLSIARFGEERWETDGIACVALGNSDGTPLGLLADEWGWELAAERRVHVFGRWKFGTPYADLTCLRSLTATLRVGDWMIVEPSWMPSYATGERGITDGYAQIIAIADLDCSWRRLTVELVPASIALWGVSYETTAAFGAGAGLGAVALSSQSESTTAVLGAGGGMRTSTRAGSTATQSETTSGTFGAGAGSADT